MRALKAIAILALVATHNPSVGVCQNLEPNRYSVWTGTIQDARLTENVSVIVAEVTLDEETTTVGVVVNQEGLRVAFADSTEDRPMVSVATIPTDTMSLLELWSDGTCEHVEFLRRQREVPLLASASRILDSLPRNFPTLIRILKDDSVLKRTIAHFKDVVDAGQQGSDKVLLSRQMTDTPPRTFEENKPEVIDRFVAAVDFRSEMDETNTIKPPVLTRRSRNQTGAGTLGGAAAHRAW